MKACWPLIGLDGTDQMLSPSSSLHAVDQIVEPVTDVRNEVLFRILRAPVTDDLQFLKVVFFLNLNLLYSLQD